MTTKNIARWALAVLALAVSLWTWHHFSIQLEPPLTVADLRISAADFPQLDHLEIKHELIDQNPDDQTVPEMVKMVRELGIRSSATYNIWVRTSAQPLPIKTRVNVFRDADSAAVDMSKRYSPEVRALSSRLSLGDDAFNLQDRLVVFRIGRVQVEMAVREAPDRLMGLAASYAQLVTDRLER